jgi:putative addiction module component (TIGR02574 family)
MNPTLEQLKIEDLSIAERLDLIGFLWDSITDSAPDTPIPEWHRQELERRRAAAEADPGAGVPWEEVKARLQRSS